MVMVTSPANVPVIAFGIAAERKTKRVDVFARTELAEYSRLLHERLHGRGPVESCSACGRLST